MDGTIVNVAVSVVAIIVAIIVPILLYLRSQRDKRTDEEKALSDKREAEERAIRATEKAAVRVFIAGLLNIHLLFGPPNDHPDIGHTMLRLDEIRDSAVKLHPALHDAKDTAAAKKIIDSCYETQIALRAYDNPPLTGPVRFADVLNHFRQQLKPLVGGIFDRHDIPEQDRPRIEPYLAGESDRGETQHA